MNTYSWNQMKDSKSNFKRVLKIGAYVEEQKPWFNNFRQKIGEKFDQIFLKKNANFFARKFAKIAENCYHNIDLRSLKLNSHSSHSLSSLYQVPGWPDAFVKKWRKRLPHSFIVKINPFMLPC
jgi:hypothetical protein